MRTENCGFCGENIPLLDNERGYCRNCEHDDDPDRTCRGFKRVDTFCPNCKEPVAVCTVPSPYINWVLVYAAVLIIILIGAMNHETLYPR